MIIDPFAQSYGKTTKRSIDKFEKSIGLTLPMEYREFLMKYNGGVFDSYDTVVTQLGKTVTVDVLFGLDIVPQLNLISIHKLVSEDLPERSFSIGRDPGGNLYLMDLSDPNELGAVYYWDIHRLLRKRTKKAIAYQITTSFTAFIEGLETA